MAAIIRSRCTQSGSGHFAEARQSKPKKAIHLQLVKSHKMDKPGELWALMDTLNVLDDLLKLNQTHLPRRA
jgi:hypothetical protein